MGVLLDAVMDPRPDQFSFWVPIIVIVVVAALIMFLREVCNKEPSDEDEKNDTDD